MARRYLPISAPGGAPIGRAGGRLDVVGLGLIAGRRARACSTAWCTCMRATLDRRPGRCSACSAGRDRRLHRITSGAAPAADGAAACSTHRAFAMGGVVAFIYGMALFGSTYLVPAVVHAGRAAPAAVAGRRGAAAGRLSSLA